jgi:hypothetical protein
MVIGLNVNIEYIYDHVFYNQTLVDLIILMFHKSTNPAVTRISDNGI